MSYVKANSPRVFIFDIETGQQEIVGEFPGMTFALVFLQMEKNCNVLF